MARVAEALSSYLQFQVEAARAAQSQNSSSSRRQCVDSEEAIYSRARAAINQIKRRPIIRDSFIDLRYLLALKALDS